MQMNKDTILAGIFFVLFFAVIGTSFYKYFYTKNYDYLVEASCDTSIESCFFRDCTNPDDCPPNGLSEYKAYYVNAADFAQCADNSCKAECEAGSISCTPIACDESVGDTCSIAMSGSPEAAY